MYYWNGAGYSVLKRSGLRPFNKNQFSILLTFRTFDENALLFLAVDEVNVSCFYYQKLNKKYNIILQIAVNNLLLFYIYRTDQFLSN